MALTIKHLDSNASFLLSFKPVIPDFARSAVSSRPFIVLLDPLIPGPSLITRSRNSSSTHNKPACVASLSELPEPDLVVISHHKSDRCNAATLRQLPSSGTRTLILAEPAAARVIRGWRYFDRAKVRTLERWEDPRLTGVQTAVRVPVPAVVAGGQRGEVTVSFVPQKKRDPAGPHCAIGITYRPPSFPNLHVMIPTPVQQQKGLATPPTTPDSNNTGGSSALTTRVSATDTMLYPPSPPISPRSLRSVQSASTLLSPPTQPNAATLNDSDDGTTKPPPHAHSPPRRPASYYHHHYRSQHMTPRPLSVLFSPQGIAYAHLAAYATSHLVSEAALPLTALLHPMDHVATRPHPRWWRWPLLSSGGAGANFCGAGAGGAGAEIAARLGARVWVGAQDGDGDREVRGLLTTGVLRARRRARDDVPHTVGAAEDATDADDQETRQPAHPLSAVAGATEVIRLGSGEEVSVCADRVLWSSSPAPGDGSGGGGERERELAADRSAGRDQVREEGKKNRSSGNSGNKGPTRTDSPRKKEEARTEKKLTMASTTASKKMMALRTKASWLGLATSRMSRT
ncbi:hypothetical protein DL771_000466 [Monosporascus sp. 5C6A]|nr:hypothetical protein DL771_000466 [Monosporascus sp. 5C6A]